MLGYIGVTDYAWFKFLRSEPPLDEVNFWRPSDLRTPRQLLPGTPFLFKLKQGFGDQIVGFGIFARHEVLPVRHAWDTFLRNNGAPDLPGLRRQVERLRGHSAETGTARVDYKIGCIMLSEPVFFEQTDWVAPPAGWPVNAVQGKGYDFASGEGARVWEQCKLAAAGATHTLAARRESDHDHTPRYGAPVPITPRLGQGTFRLAVAAAYGQSCAVTHEHSLPALEAAHIRPYGEGGEHEITNGLLLRSDIHKLFDAGYVGVTPDYRFLVSDRLRSDYSNGRSYYPLSGQEIRKPLSNSEWPNRELLDWHLATTFKR